MSLQRAAAALLLALVSLVGLAGCAVFSGAPGPAATRSNTEGGADNLLPAAPAGQQGVEIVIDAPADLKTLLQRHLDLVRLGRLSRDEVDDTEWSRLIDATPAQVRELLQTEGYFSPQVMLDRDPGTPSAYQVTNRHTAHENAQGRQIVVTDSIVFGTDADRRNVLVTAGHTGRSGARHIIKVRPFGFICSDGGRGRDDSGMAGLEITNAEGIAGATVDARYARMGDGMSTYQDGIISAANELALACGVRIGMPARDAALLLVNRDAA